MAAFKNAFFWSLSRHDVFSRCYRRYYYQYYGYWHGWRSDADEKASLVYRLKQMADARMLAGRAVHETIQDIVSRMKAGQTMPPEEATALALDRFRSGWSASSSHRWTANPKKGVNLFEHYYGASLGDHDKEALKMRIEESVAGFYDSRAFARLQALLTSAFLGNDEDFTSFEADGVTVYARPDCVVENDDGLTIYDWKTGQPSDHRVQLGIYALYGTDAWALPDNRLSTEAVFLLTRPGSRRAGADDHPLGANPHAVSRRSRHNSYCPRTNCVTRLA